MHIQYIDAHTGETMEKRQNTRHGGIGERYSDVTTEIKSNANTKLHYPSVTQVHPHPSHTFIPLTAYQSFSLVLQPSFLSPSLPLSLCLFLTISDLIFCWLTSTGTTSSRRFYLHYLPISYPSPGRKSPSDSSTTLLCTLCVRNIYMCIYLLRRERTEI